MDQVEIRERLDKFCESNSLDAEVLSQAVEGEPIVWECAICGEELVRWTFPYVKVGREAYNCHLCGSPHLILDRYGDEQCDQVVDDELYIGMTEDCGASFCSCCEEGFGSQPDGQVVVYQAEGGKFSGAYNGPVLQNVEGYYGESTGFYDLSAGVQAAVKGIVEGSHWVRTDGWRGYTQPGSAEGYEKLADGWVGWGASGGGRDWLESLPEKAQEWGVDLIVVASTTSNLFSVGVDVYVPSAVVERVKAEVVGENLSMVEAGGRGIAGNLGVR